MILAALLAVATPCPLELKLSELAAPRGALERANEQNCWREYRWQEPAQQSGAQPFLNQPYAVGSTHLMHLALFGESLRIGFDVLVIPGGGGTIGTDSFVVAPAIRLPTAWSLKAEHLIDPLVMAGGMAVIGGVLYTLINAVGHPHK